MVLHGIWLCTPPNGRSRGFHKPNGLKETTHLPKGSFIPAPRTRLTAHLGSGAPRTRTHLSSAESCPSRRNAAKQRAACIPLQRSADRLKTPALRLRLFAALRDRCVLNRAKASPLLHQTKCRTQHADQGTARKTACGRTRALPQRPRMRSKKDFFSGYIKYWYSSRCSLKYTG